MTRGLSLLNSTPPLRDRCQTRCYKTRSKGRRSTAAQQLAERRQRVRYLYASTCCSPAARSPDVPFHPPHAFAHDSMLFQTSAVVSIQPKALAAACGRRSARMQAGPGVWRRSILDMSESEPAKQMAHDPMTPIPPPTWAARRDWRPIVVQPAAERAAPFTDRELARLKFTKWLLETGRLIP